MTVLKSDTLGPDTYIPFPPPVTNGSDGRDAPSGGASGLFRPLEQLENLRTYPSNWDGYGAGPFDPKLISTVQAFLGGLPQKADLPFPAIVPMSSGAIQLEWHAADRILELEFESPEVIHYLKWWPQRGIEEEANYPMADGRQSSRLIEWVLRGYDTG